MAASLTSVVQNFVISLAKTWRSYLHPHQFVVLDSILLRARSYPQPEVPGDAKRHSVLLYVITQVEFVSTVGPSSWFRRACRNDAPAPPPQRKVELVYDTLYVFRIHTMGRHTPT